MRRRVSGNSGRGWGVICDYTASCVIHSWALNSLLEYTLTAWWSTCQGQPDLFWTYSSASLITEGQRSAPGGMLIRKTFPLSFALCLAIPFLTNVFSLLSWLAAMDFLHIRPTLWVEYANNPVCDFTKHYGGVMEYRLYQMVMALCFLYTVGLKDFGRLLHGTQCISKNSKEQIHGVNMAACLKIFLLTSAAVVDTAVHIRFRHPEYIALTVSPSL